MKAYIIWMFGVLLLVSLTKLYANEPSHINTGANAIQYRTPIAHQVALNATRLDREFRAGAYDETRYLPDQYHVNQYYSGQIGGTSIAYTKNSVNESNITVRVKDSDNAWISAGAKQLSNTATQDGKSINVLKVAK